MSPGRRDIRRCHPGVGALQGHGHADAAAAAAQIQHGGRRLAANTLQGQLAQQLGLGPGNQHRRRHPEGAAEERLLPEDVLQGLPGRAPRTEALKGFELFFVQHGVRVQAQGEGLPAGHMGQQQGGVHPGVRHTGLAQAPGGLADELSGRHASAAASAVSAASVSGT